MKLRIRGNSIRLRLTRAEVQRLQSGGTVEEQVDFGIGKEKFTYLVRPDEGIDSIDAEYEHGRLGVSVPAEMLRGWADSDEVSVSGGGNGPQILVEKDFACLKERAGEDETDMFPNPAAGAC